MSSSSSYGTGPQQQRALTVFWVPTPEMCGAFPGDARAGLLASTVTMPHRPQEKRARALAAEAVRASGAGV
jgi:hypothetical protein